MLEVELQAERFKSTHWEILIRMLFSHLFLHVELVIHATHFYMGYMDFIKIE